MHAMERFVPLARCGVVVAGLLLFAGIGSAATDQSLLLRLTARHGRGQPAPPPSPKLIISDVIIQGNRNVSTETIRGQLRTRPGQEYVAEIVQEDVRTLYGTKQFGNVVAETRADGDGKIRVFFTIRDYPRVIDKIEYKGAYAIKKDDLEKVTGLRRGLPLNPLANKVACRRIVGKYNEEGYPLASCDLLKGGDPEDTEVIFNITEGHKIRVKDIQFTGNTFVSSERLRTQVNVSDGVLRAGLFGSTYNPGLIDSDINDLIKYYRAFGYHDVRVGRSLRWTPDGKGVVVVFHIDEGMRYRIKNLPEVHGAKSTPAEVFEAMTRFKLGDYYSDTKIKQDSQQIENYIGYTGRKAVVRAEPVWLPDSPGLVTVSYNVEELAPAKVGQIIVVGNDRTRMNVILRQIPLYPGQILTYPDLVQAEKNLARLGIFQGGENKPKVEVIDNPFDRENPTKDILVTVNEDNTGSLMFGLGVNSDSGLTGSIVLNERNFDLFHPPTTLDDLFNGSAFRGAGQEFRLEAVPGTQLQRYTASLREPFLFDSPFSLTTSGYYYQRSYNEYSEDRIGARITLGRKLDNYWSVSGGMRIENVDVYNVAAGAPATYTSVIGDNFLLGFQAGITRDTRDSYLRATEGSLVSLTYEQVTGDFNFPLINLDASKYFTTFQRADGSGKQVLVVHSQVGWAGTDTPVFERYFGGGFRSVRGFAFRGIGPEVDGFKTGGDFMLLNSLEYQVPIRASDNIYVVGFLDSGAVSERATHIDDYRVSAGFGLRFVVPMLGPVPIALDFGFPIVKGPNDNTQVFNFWMGFSR
jgi:outer membrane protein assembly complex protein YaeT